MNGWAERRLGISVIIPTYQRSSSVERALGALATQTLAAHTFEVLVVIDGHEDATRELGSRLTTPYRFRLIERAHRGRAATRNAGSAAAEGDLLVFLDDDMEPSPRLLEEHQRAHSSRPRLAVVGAVPIVLGPRSTPVARYIATRFNQHLQTLAEPGYQFKVRDFFGGNFSVRREVLAEVGGFDEEFAVYGNEDVELSIRLRDAGVQLVFQPEALAYQHYNKQFSHLTQDTIDKGRTAVLLASKHPAVLPHLRLSEFGRGSRRWRALRGTLLLLARICPPTVPWVLRLGNWLSGQDQARLHRYLPLVLDYCFWMGARAAQREHGVPF